MPRSAQELLDAAELEVEPLRARDLAKGQLAVDTTDGNAYNVLAIAALGGHDFTIRAVPAAPQDGAAAITTNGTTPAPMGDPRELVYTSVIQRFSACHAGSGTLQLRSPTEGIDRTLETFDHPALHRSLQWDLAQAAERVADRVSRVRDPEMRALIDRCLAVHHDVVAPRLPSLRRGVIHGELELRGRRHAVDVAFTLNRIANDPYAFARKAGFSASASLSRSDFGMNRYADVVGETITLRFEIEGIADPDAAKAHDGGSDDGDQE